MNQVPGMGRQLKFLSCAAGRASLEDHQCRADCRSRPAADSGLSAFLRTGGFQVVTGGPPRRGGLATLVRQAAASSDAEQPTVAQRC